MFKTCYFCFILYVFTWCCARGAIQEIVLEYPNGLKREKLTDGGRVICEPLSEVSGMAVSLLNPNCVWTHNDSGDLPRLFYFEKENGAMEMWGESYSMLFTERKANRDWEDLCLGTNGKLYIGAFGNNLKRRKSGSVLFFDEPLLSTYIQGVEASEIAYYYESSSMGEKTEFVSEDCEALFQYGNSLVLLSKRMLRNFSDVYVLKDAIEKDKNTEMLAQFVVRLQGLRGVTSADSWNAGEKIAVLTYGAIWLFEPEQLKDLSKAFDRGRVMRISAKQCESICFENSDTLLLTNEQRDIYRIDLKRMSEF